MKHFESFFKGVRKNNIYYQSWHPETDAKAVLLVAHGLAEHSGRYMNFVNHFVPEGFTVYALDHFGHGRSDGTRIYVDRFTDYTKTLKTFYNLVAEKEMGKPIYIVGHSMGGLISAVYLIDHQADFQGAILSGPGVKIPEDTSKITIAIGKFLSLIAPKAGLIGLDANFVSSDPAVVDGYLNDPLVYTGKITARLAAEMLSSMERIKKESHKITLPIIIVQGSEDKLADPTGAEELHQKISSKYKTLKIYDGFSHEVFNEPDHKRVMLDIHEWLNNRLN